MTHQKDPTVPSWHFLCSDFWLGKIMTDLSLLFKPCSVDHFVICSQNHAECMYLYVFSGSHTF